MTIKRVFFALPVPESTRGLIYEQRRRLLEAFPDKKVGRMVPENNYHVTLAFLGNADDSQIETLKQSFDSIGCSSFQLRLTYFGQFPKSRALWLGPSEIPEALTKLVKTVQECTKPLGFSFSDTYRPHVTLVRNSKLSKEELERVEVSTPIDFHCRRFDLFESCSSESGVVYRSLAYWNLQEEKE